MQILPYHRVVKDLNGRTPEAFLAEVRARVRGAPRRSGRGAEGRVRDVSRAAAWHAASHLDGGPAIADPVAGLDVQRLHDRAAGAGPRHRRRAHRQADRLRRRHPRRRRSWSGSSTAARRRSAFAMFPTTVDDLVAIADAGGIMPPKSTWFEPKLRDGLLDAPDLGQARVARPAGSVDVPWAFPRGRWPRPGAPMSVLVADAFEESGLTALKAAGCEVALPARPQGRRAGRGDPRRRRAEVLVVRSTKVTEAMLDAGRLALVVRAGAGYNTIDVAAASARGIYVSNCPGKNAIAVAELTFALLLAHRSPRRRQRRRSARRHLEQEALRQGDAAWPARRSASLGAGAHRARGDPPGARLRHAGACCGAAASTAAATR